MVKIPRVNNYKQYLLTDKGVEVMYLNGKQECLVANRTFKTFLDGNNLTLSKDGEIVKNNKNKVKNVTSKPKPKNKPVSRVKPKPKATSIKSKPTK